MTSKFMTRTGIRPKNSPNPAPVKKSFMHKAKENAGKVMAGATALKAGYDKVTGAIDTAKTIKKGVDIVRAGKVKETAKNAVLKAARAAGTNAGSLKGTAARLGGAISKAARAGNVAHKLAMAGKVARVGLTVASRVAPYAAGGKVGLAIGAGTLAAYGAKKIYDNRKEIKAGIQNAAKTIKSKF
jgi:hypothetical protein